MKLSQEQIDKIFEESKNQHDAWLRLYQHVYPNWSEIEKLEDYPQVNQTTSEYIFSKFIDLDKKLHPDVIAGGLWMSLGFSSLYSHSLPDWEVVPCEYTLK